MKVAFSLFYVVYDTNINVLAVNKVIKLTNCFTVSLKIFKVSAITNGTSDSTCSDGTLWLFFRFQYLTGITVVIFFK